MFDTMDPVLFAILTNCILVVGLMSIFFACFTMLLILLWPRRYFLPEIILQFLLAVVLNITNGFVRLLQSDHETSCVATAWIDHYSMLAVFFWVAIPSYELTFTLRDSTGCLPSENSRSIDQRSHRSLERDGRNRQIGYSIVAWGIPLALTSLTLLVHLMYPQWETRVYGGVYCTVHQQFSFLFAYVLPQFGLMFLALSCFAFVVHQYSSVPFSAQLKESIYFVLIIMVWTETLWCLNLVYNLLASDILFISYWFAISCLPGSVGIFATYRCWGIPSDTDSQIHTHPNHNLSPNCADGNPQMSAYCSPLHHSQTLLRPKASSANGTLSYGLNHLLQSPNHMYSPIHFSSTFRPVNSQQFNPFLCQISPNNNFVATMPSKKPKHRGDVENRWPKTLTRAKPTSVNSTSREYVIRHPTSNTLPRRFGSWDCTLNSGGEVGVSFHQQRRSFQSEYFATNSEHSDGSNSNTTHNAITTIDPRVNCEQSAQSSSSRNINKNKNGLV